MLVWQESNQKMKQIQRVQMSPRCDRFKMMWEKYRTDIKLSLCEPAVFLEWGSRRFILSAKIKSSMYCKTISNIMYKVLPDLIKHWSKCSKRTALKWIRDFHKQKLVNIHTLKWGLLDQLMCCLFAHTLQCTHSHTQRGDETSGFTWVILCTATEPAHPSRAARKRADYHGPKQAQHDAAAQVSLMFPVFSICHFLSNVKGKCLLSLFFNSP